MNEKEKLELEQIMDVVRRSFQDFLGRRSIFSAAEDRVAVEEAKEHVDPAYRPILEEAGKVVFGVGNIYVTGMKDGEVQLTFVPKAPLNYVTLDFTIEDGIITPVKED